MSLFSIKQDATGVMQPWSAEFAVGKNIRSFYTSLGDAILTGTNTISATLDGPEKVVRYGALTIGDGSTLTTLTTTNRCKGLTILCDSLTVRNNATLHMTGKGARVMTNDDPFFPFIDFKIPNRISLSSSMMSQAGVLALIKSLGLAPWDQGTWQSVVSALYGVNWGISQAGECVLGAVANCGVGANGCGAGYQASAAGVTGGAGVGMPSGGGSGAAGCSSFAYCLSSPGNNASPYGGGSGSAAASNAANQAFWFGPYDGGNTIKDRYSGPGRVGQSNDVITGGGAGNPGSAGSGGGAGGNGVGGKLVIICFGQVTVQSGGKIEANGMPGGSGTLGGGNSGSGIIYIVTPSGLYANSGTVQCTGGTPVGSILGGAGGTAAPVVKTFTDMGSAWT